ncbi:MAG: hypothetical protein WCQ49_02105 [Candidatus Saccharibacteria bacterium]
MEAIDNQAFEPVGESEKPIESQENNSQLEISIKQELFLDIINTDKLLPKEWGNSNRPKIGYFGIVSDAGVIPFDIEGQNAVHNILADSSKDEIRESGQKWESIINKKLFIAENNKSQQTIEKRRDDALDVVALEFSDLNRLKMEISKEKAEEENNDLLKKRHNDKKDESFRSFAIRRGWYKNTDDFNYLDAMKEYKCGINYIPKFARQMRERDYQEWLKKLYHANKNILNPEEEKADGTKTWHYVHSFNTRIVGNTVENLTKQIVDIAGPNVISEIEKIRNEMSIHYTIKSAYKEKKQRWWDGFWASKKVDGYYVPKNQNEVERVNSYFDNLLAEQKEIDQKKIDIVVADLKMSFAKKLINNNPFDEAFILPTGVVAYNGEEKISQTMPAFSDYIPQIIDPALAKMWDESWQEYVNQNLDQDITKISVGINNYIDTSGEKNHSKEIFDKHNMHYDDKLIDEETGYFSPNIDSDELEMIDSLLDKYDSFIGSVAYSNVDLRFGMKISDWRDELLNNIRGTILVAPLFVRQTFRKNSNGLRLNMNRIPADVDNDVKVLELAVQVSIWENMDKAMKSRYYDMWGNRFNVPQKTFVKLFGEFLYNEPKRKELLARAMFLNQFSKWQKNELVDEQKDFFDQLASTYKTK